MTTDFNEKDFFPGPEDNFFKLMARSSFAISPSSAKEQFYHLISGYKDAADFLVAHASAVQQDARKFGSPILFLYRHHLELALKNLILDCCSLLGRKEDFPKIHPLNELWKVCCDLLHDISPEMSTNEEIQQTTRLLANFQKVDPNSMTFRYPEDKDKNSPLLDDVVFDLSNVREVVRKISLLLECIGEQLNLLKEKNF